MKVWVTRDKSKCPESYVCIFYDGTKPVKTSKCFWLCIEVGRVIMQENNRHFKSLFGFTPRKGTCKQYELTLTEIE